MGHVDLTGYGTAGAKRDNAHNNEATTFFIGDAVSGQPYAF